MEQTFDVIVLGLGAMGAAAAYQLKKRGATVLGIDQFKPPHENGSTYGDTRITRIACGEGSEYSIFSKRSHEIWRDIERQTGQQLLTQNGILVISGKGQRAAGHENREFLRTTIEAAEAAGINYQILSGSEAKSRFPAFNLAHDDVVYYDDVGGFVRPEACIRTQLHLAKMMGVDFKYHEKVTEFGQRDGAVWVDTVNGSYRGKRLILTAGCWLPSLLPLAYRDRFTIRRQVLYWFQVKDGENNLANFAPENFPVYIWQIPAPQIIYGFPAVDGPRAGVKIATEQYDFSTTPQTVDRTVSAEEARAMYETYVCPYFPQLSPIPIKTNVCLYTCIPGARFIIDKHPEFDRVIVASPCSGHGFKHSAAIGELLALMAMDQRHEDITKFAFH
jgi:sarcosine oxidase